MGKKISFNLSKDSIDKAIKELEEYRQSIIDKNALFVQRLAEIGIPVINENMAMTVGDSDTNHNTYIKINSYQDYSQATLVTEGRDLFFIEFGAGVHYNGAAGSSPHQKGEELGYTIGSYGKGLGKNDSWYYMAESGEIVKSYGTESTMPVYKASVEIQNRIVDIAKEVFGG